jgi:hypothetical protein
MPKYRFTTDEAIHLSGDEYSHYAELGLIEGVTAISMHQIMQYEERLRYIDWQLRDMTEQKSDSEGRIEELEHLLANVERDLLRAKVIHAEINNVVHPW